MLAGFKGWIILGVVCLLAVCAAIVARNIRKMLEPTRPPHSASYAVASVPNGATIEVYFGIGGRRTQNITLADIAAAGGSLAEDSRSYLEGLAGRRVRVETPRHGVFRGEGESSRLHGEPEESEVQPDCESSAVEARGPIVGVVYGETGCCLNLEQIKAGLATCLPSATKAMKVEEAIAKKHKRGVWK